MGLGDVTQIFICRKPEDLCLVIIPTVVQVERGQRLGGKTGRERFFLDRQRSEKSNENKWMHACTEHMGGLNAHNGKSGIARHYRI
jgi:hypothetical protein